MKGIFGDIYFHASIIPEARKNNPAPTKANREIPDSAPATIIVGSAVGSSNSNAADELSEAESTSLVGEIVGLGVGVEVDVGFGVGVGVFVAVGAFVGVGVLVGVDVGAIDSLNTTSSK